MIRWLVAAGALALVALAVAAAALFAPWLYIRSATRMRLPCPFVFVGDSVRLVAEVSGYGEAPPRYDSDLPWPFYRYFTWRVVPPESRSAAPEWTLPNCVPLPPLGDSILAAAVAAHARRLRLPGRAEISERGEVVGIEAGTVLLEVTAGSHRQLTECIVMDPPQRIIVAPATSMVAPGEQITISLVVDPAPDPFLERAITPLVTGATRRDGDAIALTRFRQIVPGHWETDVRAYTPGIYRLVVRYASRLMLVNVVVDSIPPIEREDITRQALPSNER